MLKPSLFPRAQIFLVLSNHCPRFCPLFHLCTLNFSESLWPSGHRFALTHFLPPWGDLFFWPGWDYLKKTALLFFGHSLPTFLRFFSEVLNLGHAFSLLRKFILPFLPVFYQSHSPPRFPFTSLLLYLLSLPLRLSIRSPQIPSSFSRSTSFFFSLRAHFSPTLEQV